MRVGEVERAARCSPVPASTHVTSAGERRTSPDGERQHTTDEEQRDVTQILSAEKPLIVTSDR
jgi:hypothetical protein